MREDFKICIWSYFSVEEYIKIIKQKFDLYKPTSFYHIKLKVSLHLSQVI